MLLVFVRLRTLPPVPRFFKYFGGHDRELEHEVSGARLIANAFRSGSSRNSTSRRSDGKSDKLSRTHG
jgi:hypothetical protein